MKGQKSQIEGSTMHMQLAVGNRIRRRQERNKYEVLTVVFRRFLYIAKSLEHREYADRSLCYAALGTGLCQRRSRFHMAWRYHL